MMRSGVLQVVSGVALAAAVAVAIGCSQDPLNSGSQGITMKFTPSPSGAGRFDEAGFDISRIQALPADPDQAALFGNERLTFRLSPYPANLTLEAPATYATIALSAGTYNVTLIEFGAMQLVDSDIAPPPYATCMDAREVINANTVPGAPQNGYVFTLTTPQSDLSALTFTVNPGQTEVALTFNVPGLIAGYQSAFTCEYQPCPGCELDPRPVTTAFDASVFRTVLLANVSIH